MSNLAFCLERRKAELPATIKVIKAIPADKLGHKPEEKARTAGDLAWVLAGEEESLVELLDKGEFDWKESAAPKSTDEIAAHLAKHHELVNERLAKLDEATWGKPGKMLYEGQVVWTDTVGNMVWGMLFDGIHHRGQLSTYLRPMGSKVPAIYGPSADDSGQ